MLDQPTGRHQASPRPPSADHVEVDVGAVTSDNIAKVLPMSERQDRGSYKASPCPASDQSITPVTSSPSTNTWVICRSPCTNQYPGPVCSLGDPAVARNQVGRKDAVRDEPLAFAVESRCDLV